MIPNDSMLKSLSVVNGNSRSVRQKEKKRTECINKAFTDLRRCIPNVPPDTKLSKIKTLRLASSYIHYLSDILQNGDPEDVRGSEEFCADLKILKNTRERRKNYRVVSSYDIKESNFYSCN